MRRFTIAPDRIDGGRVTFDRDESRHLARVLRLRPGDTVIGADGSGRDYTVRIETIGAEEATGTILAVATRAVESSLRITLVQGVPKGDKMEQIIRAATELGVARVLPALTERTIVRLEPGRWRERARRWQRVAREAAKQCGRAAIPEVEAPRALGDCLEAAEGDLRLCLWEGEAPALASVLDATARAPRTAAVLVGPEGGLARDEVEAARGRGWNPAGVGPRVLRTETAGPAIIAVLQYRFGDLASHSAT
jgi:16S rRNA (uracil1498-N3)-methyltransferase